jgi:hypothetical protein
MEEAQPGTSSHQDVKDALIAATHRIVELERIIADLQQRVGIAEGGQTNETHPRGYWKR